MAVEFKDYYATLGVERGASAEEIQRAYRAKARKLHPDVNKSPGAEAEFKQLSEAYEVLRDPEKRRRYDALGSRWKEGQEFRPPPGWESAAGRDFQFDFDTKDVDLGGFSDFFAALFGGRGFATRPSGPVQRRGRDHEVELPLTLEEVVRGGTKAIQVVRDGPGPDGRVQRQQRSYDVTLPTGLMEGTRIRLAGQGGPGRGGGPPGDLLVVVRLLPHPRYRVEGSDLRTVVQVTPWEAVLGADIALPTLRGEVVLKVPPGTSGGQVLRLRGQGLPRSARESGDLLAVVRIVVPPSPSAAERKHFAELARESSFTPAERSRKP